LIYIVQQTMFILKAMKTNIVNVALQSIQKGITLHSNTATLQTKSKIKMIVILPVKDCKNATV